MRPIVAEMNFIERVTLIDMAAGRDIVIIRFNQLVVTYELEDGEHGK